VRVLVLTAILLGGCGALDFEGAPEGSNSLLAVLRPPPPGQAARWAINPDNPDERYRGTLMLANSPFGGEELYLQLYRDAVNDPAPNVRSAGVRGLANHGTPEDAALIVDRLTDEDRNVRLEAARGLQRLHNPVAIDALIRAIDEEQGDPDADVRAEAADALGQYAERRVVLPLVGALADSSLVVNRNAARSLHTLTGQDFGFDRRAWTEWYEGTSDLFAGRSAYVYPVFWRAKRWWEYIPFVPPPPNEPEASPAGFPPIRPSHATEPQPGDTGAG